MLTKTLIVCLLALFCLQLTVAEPRLQTRIAGNTTALRGQFPYIAFLYYDYQVGNTTQTYTATGIIYGSTSVITTANVFNNFPATGGVLSIQVGSNDVNFPVQTFEFNATVGVFSISPPGTVPPNLIVLPALFTRGSSSYDVACVRLPAGSSFNFTAGNNISIATFPTSSPVRDEPLYAVAFGNQNPGGPLFPLLKSTRINLKRNSICAANLTSAGISRPFNFSFNFCVSSVAVPVTSNATFSGVCQQDIGGVILRTTDITNPAIYYEVLGLISYANDSTTCNAASPAPIIVSYLAPFINGFFAPILGTLAANNNPSNPALNTFNEGKGNFICGNGVVEPPYETCDPINDQQRLCCDENSCSRRFTAKLCEVRTGPPNKCIQRFRCNKAGQCLQANKTIPNKACFIGGVKGRCRNGACVASN